MNTMELYQKWLANADADTRAELLAIADDENEIYDRFYRNLAFGTGGMRDLIGAGTNRLNCYTVRKATLGFARYLKKMFGEEAVNFFNY